MDGPRSRGTPRGAGPPPSRWPCPPRAVGGAPRRRAASYPDSVRYLNWFLFWSRCETGMSAIHAFCDFTRRSQKEVDDTRLYTGRAAPGDIIDNTRNSSEWGPPGPKRVGELLIHVTRLCCVVFCCLRVRRRSGARCYDPCRRACNPSCDPSRSVHTRARGPRGAIAYASAARRAVGARHLK